MQAGQLQASSPRLQAAAAGLFIVLLTVLFWKLRILDPGVEAKIGMGNLDMNWAHYPMTRYGFDALREGRFPLGLHGDIDTRLPQAFCPEH